MVNPESRRIFRYLHALIAITFVAGTVTLVAFGLLISEFKQDRAAADLEQDSLIQRVTNIRQLVTDAHDATLFDLHLDETGAPAVVDALLTATEPRAGVSIDAELDPMIARLHTNATRLAAMADTGEAWRVKARTVHADLAHGTTIGKVRESLANLRNSLEEYAGRQRLSRAVEFDRWAKAAQGHVLSAADTRRLREWHIQNQALSGLMTDLAELSQLVETLNSLSSPDQLADLLNNRIQPVFRSIETTARDPETRTARGAFTDGLTLIRLTALIFGDGFEADPLTQNITLGRGGLVQLRSDVHQIEEQSLLLRHTHDQIFDQLEADAAELQQLAQSISGRIADRMVTSLQSTWQTTVISSLLAGLAFVWLAYTTDRAIRRQMLGIDERTRLLSEIIDERDAADRELRQIRTRQEVILNTIADAVCWIDVQGRIVFANPAACRLLGWEQAELVGRCAHEVLHHKTDDTTCGKQECPSVMALTEGKARRVHTEINRKRDGTPFLAEHNITAVYDDGGTISGAIILFSDITERKALEAQLHQTQKLEVIGQLAAGIAHEINTPTQYVSDNVVFLQSQFDNLLRVIQRYQALLDKAAPALPWLRRQEEIDSLLTEVDYAFLQQEIPAAIQQSLEGLSRVTTIVRAMKDFSHPGSDSFEPADINHGIESTVEVCRNRWKYVAEVELDLAPDLPHITCLIAEINQVVLNLVVNAADAIGDRYGTSGERGKIMIQTRATDDTIQIRITDNGKGMPKSVQDHIFEPFFTTKPVGKGTGQGLSLSRQIIAQRHGGRFWFESAEGVGTSFFIELAVTNAMEHAHPGRSAA